MRKLVALLALACAFISPVAYAQNNNCAQYLTYGTVLTAAQWQYCFSLKQDYGTPLASLQLQQTTVALLPTCNVTTKGTLMSVSDATSPTYNTALTGGGSVSVPAYCNGSSWVAH